ncbi:MAG: hypothetical protein Q8O83_03060 [bacterium]|nr:hypothetical protein [bacterium]
MDEIKQQNINPPPLWARNMSSGKRRALFVVVVLLLISGLTFAGYSTWKEKVQENLIQCTQEAKICPDGSAVGRTGPNCEFASCPDGNTADVPTDWKTYRNEEYGFEVGREGFVYNTNIPFFGERDSAIFPFDLLDLERGLSPGFLIEIAGLTEIARLEQLAEEQNVLVDGYQIANKEIVRYLDIKEDIFIVFSGWANKYYYFKDKNPGEEFIFYDAYIVPRADKYFILKLFGGKWARTKNNQILSTFKFIEPGFTTSGTVSGKVSIGPLCPVEPCPGTMPDVYSSRQLIFTPQGGGRPVDLPFYAKLSSDGSYSIELPESNYSVTLSKCDYLGCAYALPKNIFVKANENMELNIDIDTGIR